MAGHILELKLSDFMTYTHGVFCPEPGLNVIVGPNETGKSTLACAMVLALASKPKCLGRATLGAYVRSGCPEATIEIRLTGKQNDEYLIKRVIKRDGISSWSLNGPSCSYKTIEKLVSKLNIQVDNLCQFLPQERVQAFARMNPQALLDNTIKCTGTERVIEDFEHLKELRRTELSLEKEIATLSEKLNGSEQQTFSRKVLVENMKKSLKEKNIVKMKIESMKQKLACLGYKDDTQADLTQERSVNHKLNNVRDKVESLVQKVDDTRRNLNSNISAEDLEQKEITAIKLSIDFIKMNISISETKPGVDPAELRHVKNSLQLKVEEMRQLSGKKLEIQNQIEAVLQKIEGAQNELNINANVRLQKLQQINPDVYEAVQLLKRNKDQFQQTVHEPMKLLINLKDSANAKYVESVISERDLRAFTFENRQDMVKFLILAEHHKLKVEAVIAPESVDTSCPYSLEQLKKLGFWTVVSDLFTAPQPIMNYLCKTYKIHEIPIGMMKKVSDELPDKVKTYFTETHRQHVRKSQYSGENITTCYELNQARFLNIDMVDTAAVQRIEQNLHNLNQQKVNLEDKCLNMQTALDECKGEIAQLRDKQNALLKQQEYINQMKLKLKMKQRELDQLERQALDVEATKTACQKNIEYDILPSEDMTDNVIQEEQHYVNTGSCVSNDTSFNSTPTTTCSFNSNPTASSATPMRKNMKRKRVKDPNEGLISLISSKLRSVEPDDRHDVFGRHVASQLRYMENTQRILAEKIINNVIFEGQMNNLSRNACLTTTVIRI